ncbi:TerD family protein, partial [Loigolactobacillus coryniformis]|uniref:TerD family protein n=1 Tax=Loigolactobacillus coryniformis TaxID=1610 RepID=UPI00201A60E4
IYSAKAKNQTLKLVNNAKATVYDSTNNKVLATFILTENGGDNTGIIVGEVTDSGNNYSFKAVGTFVNGDINEIRASV